jgi:hypothetical protein
MTRISKLGEQPDTASRVRDYNAAIRAVMDVEGVNQKVAQGPDYRWARLIGYSAVKIANSVDGVPR